MKHSLDHFLREAERCVPHVTPEERRKWAEQCHAQHPGVTADSRTSFSLSRLSGQAEACPTLRIGAWRWAVLVLLLALAARAVHCQDAAGFNGGQDPAFRNVPLLWVINAPSGSCTGVEIRYAYNGTPPALYGCNQGTWTNLTAGGGGGGGSGTVTSVGTNNGLTGGTITSSGTLGLASIAAGGMLCNTGTTAQPPTIGNCGISVPQSATGTVAVSASAPLSLNATTGNLACATCLTGNQTITLSGDVSGSGATSISATVAGIEGAAIPSSVLVLGTNSSSQLIAASLASGDLWIGNGSNVPAQHAISQDASMTNAGVWTNTGINGAPVPSSVTAVAINSSGQLVAATYQGNGAKVQLSTGATTPGDCVKFDANGNTVDAGAACGSGGGSSGTNYYEAWLTSGNSWTSPSWVDANTTITIYGCGGGGGGGGNNSNGYVGSGGGAGGLFIYTAANAISASTAYTIAIGAAGAGGSAGGTGGSGGATTFTIGSTTYTANGGAGGAANLENGGAAGGSASNGTINVAGQGGWGFEYNGAGTGLSFGGSSMFGGGGVTAGSNGGGTGKNGTAGGACAGGSGALGYSGSSQTGGAGGSGLLHLIVSGS